MLFLNSTLRTFNNIIFDISELQKSQSITYSTNNNTKFSISLLFRLSLYDGVKLFFKSDFVKK